MLYDDLTAEEKRILDSWVNDQRDVMSAFQSHSCNRMQAQTDAYNASVSAILAKLDAGAIVPNTSGLQGAESLTKEDHITLQSHSDGVITGFNTEFHRQLRSRLVGVQNMR